MAGSERGLNWCHSRTAEMTTLLSATMIIFVVDETTTLAILVDHALNHLVRERRHRLDRHGDADQPFPDDLDLHRLRLDLDHSVPQRHAQLHPRLEPRLVADPLRQDDPTGFVHRGNRAAIFHGRESTTYNGS